MPDDDSRYFQLRDLDKALSADVMKKSKGNPPWIKDHVGQFHDPEYSRLTLAERGLLHDLRLLAARRGNKILNDEDYLRGQLRCSSRTRIAQKVHTLRTLRFLEPYNEATNAAAKALLPSTEPLEALYPQEPTEENLPTVEEENYPSLNGSPQKRANQKLRKRLKALVQNTGHEYTRSSLEDELRQQGADDALVAELLTLAVAKETP